MQGEVGTHCEHKLVVATPGARRRGADNGGDSGCVQWDRRGQRQQRAHVVEGPGRWVNERRAWGVAVVMRAERGERGGGVTHIDIDIQEAAFGNLESKGHTSARINVVEEALGIVGVDADAKPARAPHAQCDHNGGSRQHPRDRKHGAEWRTSVSAQPPPPVRLGLNFTTCA